MITGCVNCMKWFWIRLLQYYFPPFKVVHFSQRKMTSTIAYFLLALAPFSMALFVHFSLPSLCRTTDLQQWYDVWFCTVNVAGRLSEWHSAQTTQSIHVLQKRKDHQTEVLSWRLHILHLCALADVTQLEGFWSSPSLTRTSSHNASNFTKQLLEMNSGF